MRPTQDASSDSDSDPDPLDDDEDSMIYTAKHLSNGVAFRSRIFPRHSKGITTAPGQFGAGETETEADEPVRTPFCAAPVFYFNVHQLAETLAYCPHRTCIPAACAVKHSRTGHHPSPIRGFPTSLHRTRSIWGTLQPLSRGLRALKCKDYPD